MEPEEQHVVLDIDVDRGIDVYGPFSSLSKAKNWALSYFTWQASWQIVELLPGGGND